MPLNLNKMCRLCTANENVILFHIFDNEADKLESMSISLALRITRTINVKVHINDLLPNYICERCLFSVNKFYLFKTTCLEASFKIKKLMRTIRGVVNARRPPSDSEEGDEQNEEPSILVFRKEKVNETVVDPLSLSDGIIDVSGTDTDTDDTNQSDKFQELSSNGTVSDQIQDISITKIVQRKSTVVKPGDEPLLKQSLISKKRPEHLNVSHTEPSINCEKRFESTPTNKQKMLHIFTSTPNSHKPTHINKNTHEPSTTGPIATIEPFNSMSIESVPTIVEGVAPKSFKVVPVTTSSTCVNTKILGSPRVQSTTRPIATAIERFNFVPIDSVPTPKTFKVVPVTTSSTCINTKILESPCEQSTTRPIATAIEHFNFVPDDSVPTIVEGVTPKPFKVVPITTSSTCVNTQILESSREQSTTRPIATAIERFNFVPVNSVSTIVEGVSPKPFKVVPVTTLSTCVNTKVLESSTIMPIKTTHSILNKKIPKVSTTESIATNKVNKLTLESFNFITPEPTLLRFKPLVAHTTPPVSVAQTLMNKKTSEPSTPKPVASASIVINRVPESVTSIPTIQKSTITNDKTPNSSAAPVAPTSNIVNNKLSELPTGVKPIQGIVMKKITESSIGAHTISKKVTPETCSVGLSTPTQVMLNKETHNFSIGLSPTPARPMLQKVTRVTGIPSTPGQIILRKKTFDLTSGLPLTPAQLAGLPLTPAQLAGLPLTPAQLAGLPLTPAQLALQMKALESSAQIVVKPSTTVPRTLVHKPGHDKKTESSAAVSSAQPVINKRFPETSTAIIHTPTPSLADKTCQPSTGVPAISSQTTGKIAHEPATAVTFRTILSSKTNEPRTVVLLTPSQTIVKNLSGEPFTVVSVGRTVMGKTTPQLYTLASTGFNKNGPQRFTAIPVSRVINKVSAGTATVIPAASIAGLPATKAAPTAGLPAEKGLPTTVLPTVKAVPTTALPIAKAIPTAALPIAKVIPTAALPTAKALPTAALPIAKAISATVLSVKTTAPATMLPAATAQTAINKRLHEPLDTASVAPLHTKTSKPLTLMPPVKNAKVVKSSKKIENNKVNRKRKVTSLPAKSADTLNCTDTLALNEIKRPRLSNIERAQKQKCSKPIQLANELMEINASLIPEADDFKCHLCFKTFSVKCSLKRHLLIHTNLRPYVCTICDHAFSDNSNLLKHVRTHNQIKAFMCKLCPMSFTSNAYLLKHSKTVHNVQYKRNAQKGKVLRGASTNKELECGQCSKTFTDMKSLYKHLDEHIKANPSDSTNAIVCRLCFKVFSDDNSLMLHKIAYHGRPKYQCEFCPEGFKLKKLYEKHIKAFHNKRPYVCTVCQRAFASEYHCKEHQSKHTESKRRREKLPAEHQCELCGKVFMNMFRLIIHKELCNLMD